MRSATPPEGAGQTATDRPYVRSSFREAAGCAPLVGPPAGVLESPPRRVSWLHCIFSLFTPPVGALGAVTNRPIGRVGLGGAAGCVPFFGASRWLCRTPARKAGRLDCLIFARRPAGGAFGTGADFPRVRSRCCGTPDCVPVSGANRWD